MWKLILLLDLILLGWCKVIIELKITSILDYVFRELAVSYLGRNDLAHADNTDVDFSLGTGAEEEH